MKKNVFEKYRCPQNKDNLTLKILEESNGDIKSGELISNDGKVYKIINGIPDLIFPEKLPVEEKSIMEWYDNNYEVYDEFLPVTFDTFNVDEHEERNKMISALEIKPNYKVLETGAGTGRDSVLIADKLDNNGELHITDIHRGILEQSTSKLLEANTNIYFSICNGIHLPYPDNYFDCYYHFGGFNTFSNKKAAFAEISRVVKKGGRVVVGDESMPSWLKDSEFGKILMNTNAHYKYDLPLEDMHFTARDVKINYIIGGVFYFITYSVGDGMPFADLDFEIPGPKGGSHRTRYYGQLEGVSEKVKKLAYQASNKTGKSMHSWLNDLVKKAALKELNENNR